MYNKEFLYPSSYTENFKKYKNCKKGLIEYIKLRIQYYDDFKYIREGNMKKLQNNYCTMKNIKRIITEWNNQKEEKENC